MVLHLSAGEFWRLTSRRADVRVQKRKRDEIHDQLRREVHDAKGIQTFVLDVAPSTNALYANARSGGRFKTKHYRNWIKAQLGHLLSQRAKPAAVPASVTITLPSRLTSDGDNRTKATLDLLVRAGVLPDDRSDYVRSILTIFAPVESMHVKVEGLIQ